MKWTTILVAALALSIIGCGQKEYYMPKQAPTKDGLFVNEMRTKCNGDPTKLSAEERQKMDKITRGMTDMIIRSGPPKPGEGG